jgi:hypothetical protein
LPNIAEIAVNIATVEIIFFIKSPSHILIWLLILTLLAIPLGTKHMTASKTKKI